ncbi:MAG: hypothetical protein IPM23_08415 [Candidatus Melainabacteria bacterium]|nr:hypothetical protein [Candidatus Melainabacteria bacterium]
MLAKLLVNALIPIFLFPSAVLAGESPSGWIEDDGDSAEAGSGKSVESKGGRVTLKLGVEHADRLAPVPYGLQVGSIFDEKILSRPRSGLVWYRVPRWLAGKWKRTNEILVYEHDFETGQTFTGQRSILSQQVADFGFQLDRAGHVWHCNLASRGVSDRGSYRSIALVEMQEPVRINRDEIVFKERFLVLEVMNGSNAVSRSQRVESLTRYRPAGKGLLETTMSVKVYNQDGSPSKEQHNVSHDRVIRRFELVDSYKGEDVRSDFVKFLSATGRQDLIPETVSNPEAR